MLVSLDKLDGILSMPFIVKIFRKYIRDWNRDAQNIIYAYPISGAFDYIVIQSIGKSLLPIGWKLTAVYRVSDKMNEQKRIDLFRLFKGMECELISEGIFKKKYYFRTLKSLGILNKYFPEIIISDNLVSLLNENGRIMKLISLARPDELLITLDSLPDEFKPFSDVDDALLYGFTLFFKNPTHITWLISIEKLFSRGIDTQKSADATFELFEEISAVIKDVVKRYLI